MTLNSKGTNLYIMVLRITLQILQFRKYGFIIVQFKECLLYEDKYVPKTKFYSESVVISETYKYHINDNVILNIWLTACLNFSIIEVQVSQYYEL